jgi:hypothetical protein
LKGDNLMKMETSYKFSAESIIFGGKRKDNGEVWVY